MIHSPALLYSTHKHAAFHGPPKSPGFTQRENTQFSELGLPKVGRGKPPGDGRRPQGFTGNGVESETGRFNTKALNFGGRSNEV